MILVEVSHYDSFLRHPHTSSTYIVIREALLQRLCWMNPVCTLEPAVNAPYQVYMGV